MEEDDKPQDVSFSEQDSVREIKKPFHNPNRVTFQDNKVREMEKEMSQLKEVMEARDKRVDEILDLLKGDKRPNSSSYRRDDSRSYSPQRSYRNSYSPDRRSFSPGRCDYDLIPVTQDPPVKIDIMIGDKVDMIGFRIEVIDLETIVLVMIDKESMSISPITQEIVRPIDLMIGPNIVPEVTVQTHSTDLPLDLLPLVSIGVNLTVSHSCIRKKKLTITQKNKG